MELSLQLDARHEETLTEYGLKKFAEFRIGEGCRSHLTFTDREISTLRESIYAWLIDGNVVRIGSCKSSLFERTTSASRWLEHRLCGTDGIRNEARRRREHADAARWGMLLSSRDQFAEVWGRQGSVVFTPLGKINAYLSEENVLLTRFKPLLNNSHFR